MGFFDIFRKKKKPKEAPEPDYGADYGYPAQYPAQYAAPAELPVDQILSLRQQGLTNNQVIQTLQSQGYQPQQIYDAMAQIEMSSAAAPVPPEVRGPALPEEQMPAELPKGFEEKAEAIVEEKWQEFSKQVETLNAWKAGITERVDKLEQSVADFKNDLNTLHKAIVSKISDYDKSLQDVGVEIKAMEKVFQKVLPELTGSVTELARITKSVKGRAPSETVKKKPARKK